MKWLFMRNVRLTSAEVIVLHNNYTKIMIIAQTLILDLVWQSISPLSEKLGKLLYWFCGFFFNWNYLDESSATIYFWH